MFNRFEEILQDNEIIVNDIKNLITYTLGRSKYHSLRKNNRTYAKSIVYNAIPLEEIENEISKMLKKRYSFEKIKPRFNTFDELYIDVNFEFKSYIFAIRYSLINEIKLDSLILKNSQETFNILYHKDSVEFTYPVVHSISYTISHLMCSLKYNNGVLNQTDINSELEPHVLNLICKEDFRKNVVSFQQLFYKICLLKTENFLNFDKDIIDKFFYEILYKENLNDKKLEEFKDLVFLLEDNDLNSFVLPFDFDAKQKITINKLKDPTLYDKIQDTYIKTINYTKKIKI